MELIFSLFYTLEHPGTYLINTGQEGGCDLMYQMRAFFVLRYLSCVEVGEIQVMPSYVKE